MFQCGAGITHSVYGLYSQGSIPLRVRGSSLHHHFQMDPGGCFPREYSGWGMKLTTHILLVPKLRMHGAVPPLPQCIFMA